MTINKYPTKHLRILQTVRTRFGDWDCVGFSITSAVKDTDSPAISGGAVTQQTLSVISNCRDWELC